MMNKIRVYISHPIRGKFGPDATDEQRKEHSDKAVAFGNMHRNEFPMIDFYIPGEHYEIDTVAFRKKYMTEEQILDIDCIIISRCNFLIVYAPDGYTSGGMQIEIDHCVFNKIPVISAVDGTYKEYVARLIHAINCQLISMLR